MHLVAVLEPNVSCRIVRMLHSFPLMDWTNTSCNAAIAACEKGMVWRRAVTLLTSFHDFRLRCEEVSYSSALASLSPFNWQYRGGEELQLGLPSRSSNVASWEIPKVNAGF
eukprot:s322_g1.t1